MSEDSRSFVDTVQDSAAKEFEIWQSRHTHLIDLIERAAEARQNEERRSSTRTIETAEALIRKEYELWLKRRKRSTELLKGAAKDRETVEKQSSTKSIDTAEKREKKISGVIKAAYETQRTTAEQAYSSIAQTASSTSEETTRVVKDTLGQQQKEVEHIAQKRRSTWQRTEKGISDFLSEELTRRNKIEVAAGIASMEHVIEREGSITGIVESSYETQRITAQENLSSMFHSWEGFRGMVVENVTLLREDLKVLWDMIRADMGTIMIPWDLRPIDEFTAAVHERMVKLREALKIVWQGIAADFRLYIIDYIVAQIELIINEIIGRVMESIPPIIPPAGASQRGGNLPQIAAVAAVQPSGGIVATAPPVTHFDLHFHGPVTSTEFVRTVLLPAIEKAVQLEEVRIARTPTLETGDGNVIYG